MFKYPMVPFKNIQEYGHCINLNNLLLSFRGVVGVEETGNVKCPDSKIIKWRLLSNINISPDPIVAVTCSNGTPGSYRFKCSKNSTTEQDKKKATFLALVPFQADKATP
jgi:hypothetical protein